MGEQRHTQLTGSVDLLAVDRGAAGATRASSSSSVTRTAVRCARSSSARSQEDTKGSRADTDLGGLRLQSIPGT